MAEAAGESGTEKEAQSVCQVEGCDDPPSYIITSFFGPKGTEAVALCTADYREVSLDLKEVRLKPDAKGQSATFTLEGVTKL